MERQSEQPFFIVPATVRAEDPGADVQVHPTIGRRRMPRWRQLTGCGVEIQTGGLRFGG
jgi:hypothetical protein